MTPLHQFGEFVRDTLSNVPLWMVRMLFVGSLVAVLVWVLRLPRSETTPRDGNARDGKSPDANAGNASTRWDENLKVAASAALLIQILIYSLL